MFAGIDVAADRHTLARLDDAGAPIGRPITITEDRDGHDALLKALGTPAVLVAIEATGHYWKNLYATLVAAGHHVALLNPLAARRFQDSSLERSKTDAIDAQGLARLAFERRPAPSRLHDAETEALRELVRHRDRIRQDFVMRTACLRHDDRVRQLHRLVDLVFPEFTRHVRGLDSMLATCLLAEYPTAHAFARANPRRLAKLRYDGRHLVGPELAEQLIAAASRSIGQHHGPVYVLQARHICQDLDLWRRRLADIDRDIESLLDRHELGTLLASIDGLGPQSVARVIATVGDPSHFRSAAAFAAYVGVVPGLRQSGKRAPQRAAIGPTGHARLRMALWMPVLGAVRRNPWLRAFYERLRGNGKLPKVALIAAMRKLLHAIYSVAKHRKPFVMPAQHQAAIDPAA